MAKRKKRPNVGDRIVNEHGTLLEVVETPEDGLLDPNTVPEELVDQFMDAGYEVTDQEEVIIQSQSGSSRFRVRADNGNN